MKIEELLQHEKVKSLGITNSIDNKNRKIRIKLGNWCHYSIILNEDKTVWAIMYNDPTGTTYYEDIQELYDWIVDGKKDTGKFKANPSHWSL